MGKIRGVFTWPRMQCSRLKPSYEGHFTHKIEGPRPLQSKGHFILGPVSRAHFQTIGINQSECLHCPNGPVYGPKGIILRVGPLLLKLAWQMTWRRFGGKEPGRRQKIGSRVYGILQGLLYGPPCKVGLTLRPTSSSSGLNSKWALI